MTRVDTEIIERACDRKPINTASYGLLQVKLAHVMDYEPGDFVQSFSDAHFYSNHQDQVALQLWRSPKPLPKLRIKRQGSSIIDFTYDDFEFLNYDPDPGLKAPVAVLAI